jgi:TPR repeat protein
VSTLIFYLVLVVATASSQAWATQQSQAPEQQSVRPKLSPAEVSELRANAEEGESAAQYALGKAYQNGNGVALNDESAVKWYRKAAEQGNVAAQNDLGIMYRLGQGVNRDKEEAVRWYRKAAKHGNAQSMFNLGVSYYNGDGVPSDPTLAHAWFLLAKEAGNPSAEDAVKRSAEEGGRLGTPEAIQLVAAMCEKGDDLQRSYSEAAKWYRRAADLSPQAAVSLASMLIDGRGVPQDYGQAMNICRSAAKQGYAPAQYCVGYLYQHGLGTQTDPKEAAKWYGEASKGGQRQALLDLAEMYWKGEGVVVNRSEAYYFFFLAYRRGIPNAKTQAQVLWKEMSKDDIKHVERKLRDLRLDPQKVFAAMQAPSTSDKPDGLSQP